MPLPTHTLRRLLTHRNTIILIAAITAIGAASSYLLALLSLLMEARGLSKTFIGLSHSLQLGTTIATCMMILPVMRRYTLPMVLICAFVIILAAIAGLGAIFLQDNVTAPTLLSLRFLLGLSIATIYLLGESWLNSLAHSRNRGRVLGIYGAFLAAGLGIGPLAIPLLDTSTSFAFLLPALTFFLALVGLISIRSTAPHLPYVSTAVILRELSRSPTSLAAVIVFGISDACLLTLFPLYGLEKGLTQAQAISLVTIGSGGALVLLGPLGWLSDRMDKRLLLAACTADTALLCLLMPYAEGFLWMSLVIFLWGGLYAMLYTLPLTILGEKWAEKNIAVASLGVIFMYGIGSLIGPALGGLAMDVWGPEGLPGILLVSTLLCLGVIMLRLQQRK